MMRHFSLLLKYICVSICTTFILTAVWGLLILFVGYPFSNFKTTVTTKTYENVIFGTAGVRVGKHYGTSYDMYLPSENRVHRVKPNDFYRVSSMDCKKLQIETTNKLRMLFYLIPDGGGSNSYKYTCKD